MNQEERDIITREIRGLYTDIGLWFLSDNIKYDKERMTRLFNGRINRIKNSLDNKEEK